MTEDTLRRFLPMMFSQAFRLFCRSDGSLWVVLSGSDEHHDILVRTIAFEVSSVDKPINQLIRMD